MSPMFSNRFESSSNIDGFASTDFSISDGCTSFTSKSRNLCRPPVKLFPAAVELIVASLNVCVRFELPPAHFSNISSKLLIRSSIDGLLLGAISESLEYELNDNALDGLAGGCSMLDWE